MMRDIVDMLVSHDGCSEDDEGNLVITLRNRCKNPDGTVTLTTCMIPCYVTTKTVVPDGDDRKSLLSCFRRLNRERKRVTR